jgi:hypothetical protein
MARKDAKKLLIGSALIALIVSGLHWAFDNHHRSARARSAQSPQRPPELAPGISSPSASPATAKPPAKKGTDTVDVCGIGRVAQSENDPGANSFVDDLTRPALKRWLVALRNSDDYRARATGIFISAVMDDRHAEQSATREARDELVAMAIGSSDPAVYAIALRECALTTSDAAGSCVQLSPGGWAKLDQDNAVPWLLVAARARENNDLAAEAAAFTHASRARRSESYNFSMLRYTQPDIPADATPLERWNLAINMFGVEAAFAEPAQPAMLHCSKAALQTRAVAQQCQALAELWTTHPETVMDLMIGKSLGARGGWPLQRVQALTEKANAYMQVASEATPGREDQWSCSAVQRGNAYFAKLMGMTEIEVMQEYLEQSGETVPELARKHAEAIEKLVAEARTREREKEESSP